MTSNANEIPPWPRRVEDVTAADLMTIVAADAMVVDAAKDRMIAGNPGVGIGPDHTIHQLSIQVVLNADAFVAAMEQLLQVDPEAAEHVARAHWEAAEGSEAVERLWTMLKDDGHDVKALRKTDPL